MQLCSFSAFLEEELARRFTVHRWLEHAEHEFLLSTRASAIRAVATGGHLGVPAHLMARLPALGIIAVNGVGLDKVDLDECRRRNVRVTTTPGVLTDDVADLALGLIIALLRGIPEADRFVREGGWLRGERPLARKVSGRHFGIVGLGNIGRAIATRLAILGPVSYCDLRPQQVPYEFVSSPIELAHRSDVLILAASANASTRNLIDAEVLYALGPNGYLINIARGALIDEPALVSAVLSGRIAGAALDTFADEPNVPRELIGRPEVILTPHVASATGETREAMARAVLANLDAFFAGRAPPGAIV
jgi:lactate dehydrogenase-like 2-hydroxyacid dehydrogenase